ncbi:MAG: hypothetical protein MJE63_19770, partial [Proteobacteria bacterium]|nr:hypothetical protein [Pseudomonadota bacterium]
MLKKLLTGCLTIAMIGAFSASAAAETTFTWTGDVTGSLIQTSEKAETTGDSETITYMDMKASADLDLSVKVVGDVWTGEAKLEMDWTAAGNVKKEDVDIGGTKVDYTESTALDVDDLYVVA